VVGLGTFLDFVRNKMVLSIIYGLIVVIAGFYLINFSLKYFEQYPGLSANFYQYGARQYSEYLLTNDDKFLSVKVDANINMPYIYYLFYSGQDPHQYNHAEINTKDEGPGRWVAVSKLGKYTFDTITPEDLEKSTEIYAVKDNNNKIFYKIFAKDKNWFVVRIN
jgi:hypothetical protein